MKTKVKALTSFMHGRVHANAGDEVEVTKGEADELVAAGLAQIGGDSPVEDVAPPAEDAAPPTEDADDLLGGDTGEKMEDEPRNKMATAPENKAAKPHKAKAK